MENTTFVSYDKGNINHYKGFSKLFSNYFDEICSDNPENTIPKHIMPKIINIIGEETQKYKEWLYLCYKEVNLIGFSIFQIDTPDNPMCKRTGWGFIREFYIIPSYRRNGYAKQMCNFVEKIILNNGANNIYLTANANNGIPFWEAMGYCFAKQIDEKNGNRIYEKLISNES
jgi:ribosomal protein S18 acetylase RimI-like enzyme